ncbi:hypothetical protein Vadar_000210 [Vaccinium darrowii]|uniref:Uncharacterized protein n=1 Tax=Vaccinium darrowii TaxID=229202 RepID=A0ACB7X704_9ERIC|nr:hypothetical protein Vadar_000210 [Vaccinium darrowii]
MIETPQRREERCPEIACRKPPRFQQGRRKPTRFRRGLSEIGEGLAMFVGGWQSSGKTKIHRRSEDLPGGRRESPETEKSRRWLWKTVSGTVEARLVVRDGVPVTVEVPRTPKWSDRVWKKRDEVETRLEILAGDRALVAVEKLQKGEIGITLVTTWVKPLTNSSINIRAQKRSLDFKFGWFMDPITKGDYPSIMRSLVGNRLPKFSPKQAEMLKGSFDFLGLNYYTTTYAANELLFTISLNKSYDSDPQVLLTALKNGVPIGPQPGSSWLYVYPRGLLDLLLYIKEKYNSPPIYIIENGPGSKWKDTLHGL